MAWNTPTLVEICIGLEINGYSAGRILTCAAVRSPSKKPGQKPGFDLLR